MASEPHYRFPDGKRKALVMSYDDGSEHDRRLIELFNRYGIRASFHLNSGKLGQPHYIRPEEVRHLYQNHEVSCHTVNHPDLVQLPEAAIRREILDDKLRLEELTGAPVRGLSYPFGTHDARITALLPELGIDYGRTVVATNTFTIPGNFLTWETTCHHSLAMELGTQFLESDSPALQLMYIWGHSYELEGFMTGDPSKNWQYMEALCRLLHAHEALCYITTIDLIDYLNALRKLEFLPAERTVSNGSDRILWISWRNTTRAIGPGERRYLHD